MTETAIMPTDVPQQVQRQDALLQQVQDLYDWAIRLGMYDAADWILSSLRAQHGSEATP